MPELNTKSEPLPLAVPPSIEAVISEFDARASTFSCMDIYIDLCAARKALKEPTSGENAGAWAEVLAFGLAGTEHFEKPWGTYFGPMGSGTENGEAVYFPDVRQADTAVLVHWRRRAQSVTNPVLKARYNDLVWDLSHFIANEKRDVKFAHSAIDSYLDAACQKDRNEYDVFPEAERALTLAVQINDTFRRDAARKNLLNIHKQAIENNGMWWKVFDALEEQPRSGLTDEEREELIADLEGIIARVSDISSPENFNPHDVESAANKLLKYYRRAGRQDEIKRLHLTVAKAFEHFGGMADPMLASTVLQTSMDAYRQAGMNEEEARILRLIEKSNVESADQMIRHEITQEIPIEDIEEFLSQVIGDTKDKTFSWISAEFLVIRTKMEESLRNSAETSPLTSMIPAVMLKGDRVVAHIGSLDEDPLGRLIHQTNTHLSLVTPWLGWAIERAKERHSLSAEDITLWANRTGLFGDGQLLREGLMAWMNCDHVKAAHILVPQVEVGFRSLVGLYGRPTTKAHPQMRQARMVVTMGEILFSDETLQALGRHGSNIVLHFRTLYADPRGQNLRNDLAHGLISTESLNAGIMLWVIHSLLLLGAWLLPEGIPESETEPSAAQREDHASDKDHTS